jgi:hypothetical protein
LVPIEWTPNKKIAAKTNKITAIHLSIERFARIAMTPPPPLAHFKRGFSQATVRQRLENARPE